MNALHGEEEMRESEDSLRRGVRELLALLASEEQQLNYERQVPIADVPAELLCMWFNDNYHPGSGWSSEFTSGELEALAHFNAVYESLAQRLPRSQGTVRTWLADPSWRKIMNAAAIALGEVPE
jgi:hypothetical protein